MENKNPIQVADRLFLVMETLAETGPVTLGELCGRLELNKSTVHRLLSSLICAGYVRQNADSGKYALSFKLLTLADKVLERTDILEIVRPFLRDLSEKTGETVHFVQRDGAEAVYICKEESNRNSIRMASRVGSRIPLYCSGVGKAMLADMSKEQIDGIWKQSDVRKLTPNTIVEYDLFCEELQRVRRRGFALDLEENELGVRCIAVSISERLGSGRYAFSVSAPASRMTQERIDELETLVLDTKKRMERELN